MPSVLNMAAFRIRDGCEYTRVTRGFEYILIRMNVSL